MVAVNLSDFGRVGGLFVVGTVASGVFPIDIYTEVRSLPVQETQSNNSLPTPSAPSWSSIAFTPDAYVEIALSLATPVEKPAVSAQPPTATITFVDAPNFCRIESTDTNGVMSHG